MKKKQFMSKLAALTMAAAMGLTAVPATAVFAADATITDGDDRASSTETKDFIDNAEKTSVKVGNGTVAKVLAVDGNLDTQVQKAAEALQAFYKDEAGTNHLKAGYDNVAFANDLQAVLGAGFTVSAHPGDVTVTAAADKQTVKATNVTVTFSGTVGGASSQTVSGVYTVEFDANPVEAAKLTSAQKMDAVAKQLGDKLNGTTVAYNTKVTEATLRDQVKTYLTANGDLFGTDEGKLSNDYLKTALDGVTSSKNAGTSADIIISDVSITSDTPATVAEKGSIKGTVTLKFNAIAADDAAKKGDAPNPLKAEDAVTKTVDFTIVRNYASESLTDDTLTTVKNYLESKNYPNDATASDIAADVNKQLQAWAKEDTVTSASFIVADSDPSHYDGLTASVGALTQVEKQDHDKANADHPTAGTFKSTISLTDGTSTLATTFSGKLAHSNTEKLDEFDAAIAKAAADYQSTSIHKIQTQNAVDAASVDDVIGNGAGTKTAAGLASSSTGIYKIIYNALVSKPGKTAELRADWGSAKIGVAEVPAGKDTSIFNNNAPKSTTPSISAAVDFKAATVEAEGTAKVTVKYALTNAAGDGVDEKTTTFTLTLPKIKAKATTKLEFTKDSADLVYYAKGNSVVDRGDGYTEGESDGTVIGTFKNGDSDEDVVNYYAEDGSNKKTPENQDLDNTYDLTTGDYLYKNGNDILTWTSSDPSVATVDDNGKVTLKGNGTATITVSSKNNSSLTSSIKINAKEHYKFTDVQDENAYYFNHVYKAVQAGWVSGTSNDTFSPADPVTRAQFVTFLYRQAGSPAVSSTTSFTDVSNLSTEFQKAIAWASQKGIAKGTSATTFEPNKTVNRAQAVTFLYRAKGNGDTFNGRATAAFSDVKSGDYFEDAVNWAVAKNVTAGSDATHFSPDLDCNRGQAVTFIGRALSWKD